MTGLLTDGEILLQRAARLFRTFEHADRTLTRRPVTVIADVDPNMPAPAWSIDTEVTFNLALMKTDDFTTAEGIVATTGLNYHELAHIIYTERQYTPFRQRIQTAGYHNTWNILEDQRIERLLCGRWLAVAPFLTAVFVRYILDNPNEAGRMYPLAVGRRHLPAKVRTYLRDEFVAPVYLEDIDRIVDAYLAVQHPRNDDEAFRLVTEMHRIFTKITPPPDFNGHAGRPIATGDCEETPESMDRDSKAADDAETSGDLDPTDDGEESKDAGDGPKGGKSKKTVKDVAQEAMKEVKQRQDVKEAVAETIAAQNGVAGVLQSGLPELAVYSTIPITQETASAAYRFGDELRVIVDAAAPGWQQRQSSGRLNMRRMMDREPDLDTAFDRWSPGETDVFSIEAVALVDLSGSMANGGKRERASIGTWVVRRGIELAGGTAMTTVLGYGSPDDQHTLAQRGDSASATDVPLYPANSGSTLPGKCLTEARKIFAGSTLKHKVLFLLTDGGFTSGDVSPGPDESIMMMNESGIVTVLFYINEKTTGVRYATHNCMVHRAIVDEFDFVAGVRDVVVTLMRGGYGV